jgi:predicted ATP-grasp superfamily ATP-dependent carboligase
VRVIVTGGQYPASLAALRSLHRAGFAPIAVATRRGSYARFSRAASQVVRAPDVGQSASQFVEAVASLCDPDTTVIIPGTEPELVALVTWRHLLPGSVLGLPSVETLSHVSDKVQLNEAAGSAGFAMPETWVIDAGCEGDATLPFPAVAKPMRTVEQRGDKLVSASATRVADQLELDAFLGTLTEPRAIVQPLLRGKLYSLAGVMWRGKLHAPVQQLALSIFPEPCGGSAIARTVPLEPLLVGRLEQMLRGTGWEGIVHLQWIRIGQKDLVIDLNPRIYGSLALAHAAGSDLAAIWVRLLLGLPLLAPAPSREVLYWNLETFMRAPRGVRTCLRERTDLRASSVYASDDPWPVIASGVRGFNKFRRDLARRRPDGTELAEPRTR